MPFSHINEEIREETENSSGSIWTRYYIVLMLYSNIGLFFVLLVCNGVFHNNITTEMPDYTVYSAVGIEKHMVPDPV